jgi:hypothetical protein
MEKALNRCTDGGIRDRIKVWIEEKKGSCLPVGRNQTTAHLANGLTQCCSRSCQFLSKCAFLLTITLGDDLPTAIVVESGCPYPAPLFIDVLAKIGHVNNASSIVQTRISQLPRTNAGFGHGICQKMATRSVRQEMWTVMRFWAVFDSREMSNCEQSWNCESR